LDLTQIGRLGGINAFVGGLSILLSGWLADRYHPIRITFIGFILSLLTIPIGLIWLIWHPTPQIVFYFCAATGLVFSPIGALMGVLDPPLLMRIFPRERYGQYCSANALCRSLAVMVMGTLAGVYLDVLTKIFDRDTAYRLIPLWNLFFTALASFFMYRLYKSWKRYGGDAAYVPPGVEPETGTKEIKPIPVST
jgi:MFS family permease